MIVLDRPYNEVTTKTDELLRSEEIIQKKLLAIAQKTATDIWDIGEQLSNINDIYKAQKLTIKDWLKEKEEEMGDELIKPSTAYNWIKIYQSLPRDFMGDWQGAIHTLIAIFALPPQEQKRLLTEGKERVISGKEVTELKNSLKSPKTLTVPELDLTGKLGFWVVRMNGKAAQITQINSNSVCLDGWLRVDFSEIKEVLIPEWKSCEKINDSTDVLAESYKDWDIYLISHGKGDMHGASICSPEDKVHHFAFYVAVNDPDWLIGQAKRKIDELTKSVQEILEETAANGNRNGHLKILDKTKVTIPEHPDFDKYIIGDLVRKEDDDQVWEIINKKPESVSLKNDSGKIEIEVSYSLLSQWQAPKIEETDSIIWNPLSKELMECLEDNGYLIKGLADDWENALLIPRKTEIKEYIDKMYSLIEEEEYVHAAMVLPPLTDSEWFQDWAQEYNILFLKESPNLVFFFDQYTTEDSLRDYGVII